MRTTSLPHKLFGFALDKLGVRRSEVVAVAWSFLYFFCILSSYYMLRPIRDAMAVQSGVWTIPWLFTGTFLAMLAAAPAFGWVASRYPRKQFLPWVYYFFVANMLLFFALFHVAEDVALGAVWIGRLFFVWLSVFNLFVVSVFWAFMADIFSREQSRRLFGVISAGGSAGAILGPIVTATLVVQLTVKNMLPLAALLLLVGVFCIYRLRAWVRESSDADDDSIEADRALGGGILDGMRAVFGDPYFRNIALMVVLANFVGAVSYTFMAEFVGAAYATADEQAQAFSWIDAAINGLSLLGQLLLVSRSVRGLGMGVTLTFLPVVSAVGFGLLAWQPAFAIMVVLQILRRSLGFAFAKPASDMLYAIVPTGAKYKAKSFIDTAIYRGGDVVAIWFARLLAVIGLGTAGIALICVPVSIAWTAVALRIGAAYRHLSAQVEDRPS